MKKGKKVLLLTTPFRPNVGGVETHLDDLINEGIKKGFIFLILTYQPLITNITGKIFEKSKNLTVFRLPWLRANLFLRLEKYPALEFAYLFPGLFLIGFIYLFFKDNEIEIIHAQGLIAGTIGVILAKLFNKKVIISTHSVYNFSLNSIYRNFVKFILNSSDQILTLSFQSQQEIIQLGVDARKVNVFRYWVDQKIFKKIDKKNCRNKLNLQIDAKIVLFVGRLIEVKGVLELIKAAKKKSNIHFLIIGDGYLANTIARASQKYSNIIFKGKVDNRDLAVYYNSADVLIVPSTHEEGFGRVILEGLSCGLPVIGSNRGGIKESINSSVGQLIEVSPRNILKAIDYLISHPKILNKMSKNARVFAKKNYSFKNAQMILKYYEK